MWELPTLGTVFFILTLMGAGFQARANLPFSPVPYRYSLPMFNVVSTAIPVTGFWLLWHRTNTQTRWDLLNLGLALIIAQIYFYIGHRALHTWFYRQCHSWHHRYIRCDTWATIYAHPVDHLIANTGTMLVPLMIVDTLFHPLSYYTILIFWLVIMVNALWAHTDGLFDSMSFNHHKLHHLFFRCNYGSGTWMDQWWGTFKNQE